jgi:hypothetical protein
MGIIESIIIYESTALPDGYLCDHIKINVKIEFIAPKTTKYNKNGRLP